MQTDRKKIIQLSVLLLSACVSSFVLQSFVIFLPLFASQLGARSLEIGVIGGIPYGVYSFLPLVLGRFAKNLRRRHTLIILGFSILSPISFVYSQTTLSIYLIPLRLVEGIAWAMLIASIESSVIEYSTRGSSVLGLFNVSFSSGAILAPIIGGFIADYYSFRLQFEIITILLTIFVLLNVAVFGKMLLARSEPAIFPNENHGSYQVITNNDTNPSQRERPFYFASTTVAAMIPLVALTFLPPLARSAGISIFLIGLFTFFYPLGRTLAYVLGAISSTRARLVGKQRKKVILVSLFLCSLLTIFLTLTDRSGILYSVLFPAIGLTFSFVLTATQSALIAEAPYEKRGHGAGIFESSIGTGGFIGPIFAGVLAIFVVTPFIAPMLAYIMLLAFIGIRYIPRLTAKRS